jgi:hypothetical protein
LRGIDAIVKPIGLLLRRFQGIGIGSPLSSLLLKHRGHFRPCAGCARHHRVEAVQLREHFLKRRIGRELRDFPNSSVNVAALERWPPPLAAAFASPPCGD